LRLCYVATPYSIHTQRWIRYFADHGHQVSLIGVSPERRTIPLGMPPNVRFFDLMEQMDVRKLRFLAWTLAARRIVRTVRPDVLHAHHVAGAGWVGAGAGYHPFVVTAWGSDLLVGPQQSLVQRQLARWVLRRADYVTCVSDDLAQAAHALGANPQRLKVMPWGVNTDTYCPTSESERESIRTRLGLASGPTVLSLRRMGRIYNSLDIARAIPRVLEQVPTTQFVIRTWRCDPELFSQFQAIVQEQNVGNAVHYVSDLPDEGAIAELYQVADVVVSVPSSDGMPSSVFEALSCGAVPVLSDTASLHEWIEHEKEGVYVPIGDVAAIAEAIVRLLRDHRLRSNLQANGFRLIRERVDSKVWMRHNEELYEQLLKASQHDRGA
jgi:glycosyltransferase involved in cell wall biosynthesis